MKGIVAKVSITTGLIYGGLIVAVIAIFLPFATVTEKVLGMTIVSRDVAANGSAKLVVVLIVAAAAWLAWPTVSGSQMSRPRLIGLTVGVCLLIGLVVVWFVNVSSNNGDGDIGADVSPGFGLLLYGVAVIAIAAGVVRIWMHRPQTQQPAP
ncbi:MAG TPA: hypothetical protein VMU34_09125 [Mycobacterium sp.]|nr:hypothetical protein [Mycobacterium sp.]